MQKIQLKLHDNISHLLGLGTPCRKVEVNTCNLTNLDPFPFHPCFLAEVKVPASTKGTDSGSCLAYLELRDYSSPSCPRSGEQRLYST